MDNQAIINGLEKHDTSRLRDGLIILVVDDNLMFQQLIRQFLESDACHLDMAINGKKALEALEKNHYDLILMDLQMPEMDGFEATAHIRAMELKTGGHIPILAMTGIHLENGYLKCISKGMDDYLEKPFNITELLETIECLTNIRIQPKVY